MPTNSLRLIRSLFSLPRPAGGPSTGGPVLLAAWPIHDAWQVEERGARLQKLGQLTTAEQAGGLKAALPNTLNGDPPSAQAEQEEQAMDCYSSLSAVMGLT